MFRLHSPQPQKVTTTADRETAYRAAARRVDAAQRQMLALSGAPHSPADARAAADELSHALRAATATATLALRLSDVSCDRSSHRSGRHKIAARAIPLGTRFWGAELVRLTAISVWLRRETLDELGVHVPTAVRVGSRAATAPHVAGLDGDPDDLVAATLHQPWMGVDLRAVVDGVGDVRRAA